MAARCYSELVDGAPAGPCGPAEAAVVELTSGSVTASVLALGAATHRVLAPDRHGSMGDVQLFLGTLAERASRTRNPYLGSTVGRWAGRIAGATFPLDGRIVHVDANEGPNLLHGGPEGFDRRRWSVLTVAGADPTGGSVVLGLVSPDGDQGFPGTLRATATYALDGDQLTISYTATTDAATVVNLCHHSYWNLAGGVVAGAGPSVAGHVLSVPADRLLPLDRQGLPTGPPVPVAGTPLDLRAEQPVGAVLCALDRGLDHSYVIDGSPGTLRPAARLSSAVTGRSLTLETDQPGLQVYSGENLDAPFTPRTAISLEAQRLPDGPNHPELGAARLDPGDTYTSTTRVTFGTDG